MANQLENWCANSENKNFHLTCTVQLTDCVDWVPSFLILLKCFMVKLMQNDYLFVVNISINAKIIIYLLYHTLQFVADRIVTLSGQLK